LSILAVGTFLSLLVLAEPFRGDADLRGEIEDFMVFKGLRLV
jgi:hypothetical protein